MAKPDEKMANGEAESPTRQGRSNNGELSPATAGRSMGVPSLVTWRPVDGMTKPYIRRIPCPRGAIRTAVRQREPHGCVVPHTEVDWRTVISDLIDLSMKLSEIAAAVGGLVSTRSLRAYVNGDITPRHYRGECLLGLWSTRTGRPAHDAPRRACGGEAGE